MRINENLHYSSRSPADPLGTKDAFIMKWARLKDSFVQAFCLGTNGA